MLTDYFIVKFWIVENFAENLTERFIISLQFYPFVAFNNLAVVNKKIAGFVGNEVKRVIQRSVLFGQGNIFIE